jgi:hypothetical protein
MTTILPNQMNPIAQLLGQALQTGLLDPQQVMMLMRFLQHRARGQMPNPMQQQALTQAQGQLGPMFQDFIRALTSGNLGQFQNQLGQQPFPGAFASAQGNNAFAATGAPGCGAMAGATGPNAFAQAGMGCAPRPINCGPRPQAQNDAWKNNVIKGGEKGDWLVKHGQYKKDGNKWCITGGQYKDHTAIPMGNGQFQLNNPQGQPIGVFNAPKNQEKIASPLTFDLNGDGKVSTTGKEKQFDINGDGKMDKTAWAGKGDGVLAFDADGDGKIGTNGKELFGNNTDADGDGKADGHANGFKALQALATKHLGAEAVADGKLDKKELAALEQKTKLGMIVDGQQKSLAELGVDSIDLGFKEAGKNADENGNEHRQVGSFTKNGQKQKVNDVWFQYE